MGFRVKAFTIKTLYRYIFRPVLFKIDPESVHDKATQLGNFLGRYKATRAFTKYMLSYQHPSLSQRIAGITFKNPVGLAAGFDKDGNLINIAEALGFGFTQVGTITVKPYEGNPKPRLYRLPHSKGTLVNFGLKNIGVKKIIRKLQNGHIDNFPLGMSVGKTNSSKTSTTSAGIDDYNKCLKELCKNNIGDFYVINISCPNTFGGEPFTTPEKLSQLLNKLTKQKINKPIFLKMPINSSWNDFRKLLNIAVKFNINGVIIGNLNKNHKDVSIKDKLPAHVKGGVSGKLCKELTNKLISKTYKFYGSRLVIVGVGGIFSAEDAYEKLKLGASLVALLTGLIYEGPQLTSEINYGLAKLLQKDGYKSISHLHRKITPAKMN